ncbi:MAG TPA: GNAT family protein [Phototrophicaceae bacterium]|nr:GNAT family protein [Phototrophicaceae bacterium]
MAENSAVPLFLCGQRVALRPLEKTDCAQLLVWMNDPEIRGLTGEVLPTSPAGVDAWFDRVQNDTSRVWFVIVTLPDTRLIGEAGLLRMFPPWRTTDLRIIIGDKSAGGQGYGGEAITLLLDYAFGYLNFHRVAIGVVGSNERALRFYEKVGFQREGIQRDGYYYNHQYQDFVMLSILEDGFRARYKAAER